MLQENIKTFRKERGLTQDFWLLVHALGVVMSFTLTRNVTELTVSEVVEILEDESGNTLVIQKIEE